VDGVKKGKLKGDKMRMTHFFILVLAVLPVIPTGGYAEQEVDERPVKRAAEIHDKVLTIDTHTDTPYMLLRPGFDIGKSHDPRKRGGRVDFPRMKQGGLDAVFFAAFVGQGPRTPGGNEKANRQALKLIDAIHRAVEQYPGLAELALTADDAYKIEKKGKRAVYIGIENGFAIGTDLLAVKKFYELGVRYITLCHMANNDICDSSTDDNGPEHNGLSEFGRQVVGEMNRLGMLIDVSHISDQSFYDVLRVTKAPVVASHSCARALCDHPRNLTDDMLKKLAENGGVIQVCILSAFVKKSGPNPGRDKAFKALREKYKNYLQLSEEKRQKAREEWEKLNEKYPQTLAVVADVVDHIDHIVRTAGIDHVGIGTDFDGGGGVDGCFDVSEMGNITLELVKRGYSEKSIRKIWGGNFLNVFRKAEKMGEKQRSKKK
jgi:membrane dipeptidase